jgi:hypothetical protein
MLENPAGTNAALIEGSGGRSDPKISGPIIVEPSNEVLPDSSIGKHAVQIGHNPNPPETSV